MNSSSSGSSSTCKNRMEDETVRSKVTGCIYQLSNKEKKTLHIYAQETCVQVLPCCHCGKGGKWWGYGYGDRLPSINLSLIYFFVSCTHAHTFKE